MEAGELKLIGTLDTSDIESGQRRVGVGFDNIQDKTRSSTSSFSSLGNSASKLVTAFAAIGAVGGGAMSALVLSSPQAAGAMASIRTSTQQLSFTLGDEFSPLVDSAADSYASFVEALGTEGTFANTGLNFISSTFSEINDRISGTLDLLKELGKSEILNKLNKTGSSENDVTLSEGLAQPLLEGSVTSGLSVAGVQLLKKLGINTPQGRTGALALGAVDAVDAGVNSENEYVKTISLATGAGAAVGLVGGPAGAAAGGALGFVGGNLYYGGKTAYDSISNVWFVNTDTTGANDGG